MDATTLKPVMLEALELVKKIPKDQEDALKCVGILLDVVNQYTDWSGEMRKEMIRLMELNNQLNVQLKTFYQKQKDAGKPLIISPDDPSIT